MTDTQQNRAARRRLERASKQALKEVGITRAEVVALLNIGYDQRMSALLAEMTKHNATETEKRALVALYQRAGIL